jgi:hypothetical protein
MFLEDKINTRLLVDPSAANIRKQTSYALILILYINLGTDYLSQHLLQVPH